MAVPGAAGVSVSLLEVPDTKPGCRFLLNSHTHSPLARAMYTAIKQARVNDKFQDPLYLFLELVRAGVMHGHLWSGRAFSGGPSFGTGKRFSLTKRLSSVKRFLLDDEKSCMLLVMRVLSIVPLNFKVCCGALMNLNMDRFTHGFL
jgi:hypothetical protein